jgi:hypothetical protein
MWIEIITTAVTASVATHLGPRAYHLLVGKFVKVKAPEAEIRLGNYIESIDRSEGAPTFKLKVAPACQKTYMGNDRGIVVGPKGDPAEWDIDLEEGFNPDVKFAVIPPDYGKND